MTSAHFRKSPLLIITGMSILALLLITLLATYQESARLRERNLELLQTHGILERLALSLDDIRSAETGQRGYLLTGDSHYLTDYVSGRNDINVDLNYLQVQTHDNPVEQSRITLLRPLVAAKLSELEETILLEQRVV